MCYTYLNIGITFACLNWEGTVSVKIDIFTIWQTGSVILSAPSRRNLDETPSKPVALPGFSDKSYFLIKSCETGEITNLSHENNRE